MARELTTNIVAAKNALSSTTPFVYLLKIQLNAAQVIYLTSNNATITYGGFDWMPFPFAVGDMTEEGGGTPGALPISASNVEKILSRFIETNRGFSGGTLTLYYYSDGEALSLGEMNIQTAAYDHESATLTAGNQNLFDQPFPRRTFSRDSCQHQYKGSLCGYSGGILTCDKTLLGGNGCKAHNNVTKNGSFPGIVRPT